jgi:hypothetical protein
MEHNVYVERDIWRERAEKAEAERDALWRYVVVLVESDSGEPGWMVRMTSDRIFRTPEEAEAFAREQAGLPSREEGI